MFDIKEMEGKLPVETLENGNRVLDLEPDKVVYLKSSRTNESFKITFAKIDDSAYKVILDFESKDKKSKEVKLLTNGKMCLLLFKYILNLSVKQDGKLYIIAAEELKFYE